MQSRCVSARHPTKHIRHYGISNRIAIKISGRTKKSATERNPMFYLIENSCQTLDVDVSNVKLIYQRLSVVHSSVCYVYRQKKFADNGKIRAWNLVAREPLKNSMHPRYTCLSRKLFSRISHESLAKLCRREGRYASLSYTLLATPRPS